MLRFFTFSFGPAMKDRRWGSKKDLFLKSVKSCSGLCLDTSSAPGHPDHQDTSAPGHLSTRTPQPQATPGPGHLNHKDTSSTRTPRSTGQLHHQDTSLCCSQLQWWSRDFLTTTWKLWPTSDTDNYICREWLHVVRCWPNLLSAALS